MTSSRGHLSSYLEADMRERGILRFCIFAAAAIVIAPLMTSPGAAQRGHGGGMSRGMGGFGGGGLGGMSHSSPMMSSSPMMRSGSGLQSMPSLRSSPGFRSLSTSNGLGTSRTRSLSGTGNVTLKSLQGGSRHTSTTTILSKQTSLKTNQTKPDQQINGNHVTKTVQHVTKTVQGL